MNTLAMGVWICLTVVVVVPFLAMARLLYTHWRWIREQDERAARESRRQELRALEEKGRFHGRAFQEGYADVMNRELLHNPRLLADAIRRWEADAESSATVGRRN